MIVLPANHSSLHVGWLAGRYPGRIGWLISPGGWRTPPAWLPYALDNGAFPAWTKGTPWDADAFVALLDKAAACRRPEWVLAPDVVADRSQTLASWARWAPTLRGYGWPIAFAVQDGMTPEDVPRDASVIFVGGTTEWKWRTALDWCRCFPRVHIARVNTYGALWRAHGAGAESCDGTGWFRGDKNQLAGLDQYLAESAGRGRPQCPLPL